MRPLSLFSSINETQKWPHVIAFIPLRASMSSTLPTSRWSCLCEQVSPGPLYLSSRLLYLSACFVSSRAALVLADTQLTPSSVNFTSYATIGVYVSHFHRGRADTVGVTFSVSVYCACLDSFFIFLFATVLLVFLSMSFLMVHSLAFAFFSFVVFKKCGNKTVVPSKPSHIVGR